MQDTGEIDSKASEYSERKNRGQKVGQKISLGKQKGRYSTRTRKEALLWCLSLKAGSATVEKPVTWLVRKNIKNANA